MNTVFKFSWQAWILFGISCGVLLPRYLSRPAASPAALRGVWIRVVVLAAAASLLYPLTAPKFRQRERAGDSRQPPSWDGLAFIRTGTHRHCDTDVRLAGDLGVMQWLRSNVRGTPVIAEFNTHPQLYGWGNRMSVFTGLPAIAGWDWHLRQQMGWFDGGRVARRIEDVKQIYRPGDPAGTWSLLRRYDAQYVVWGALENACAAPALQKFEEGAGVYWDLAYRSGASRIYRVRSETGLTGPVAYPAAGSMEFARRPR